MDELKKRKTPRYQSFDYNSVGGYFITICTQNRRCILSRIVGTGVLDCPQPELTRYGEIADKYIKQLNDFYEHLSVEKYVIMPDHIHLIVRIEDTLTHKKQEIPTDLVVLSAALESSQGTIDAAKTLGVPLTEDKFIKEKHPKMQPVSTDIEGVFIDPNDKDTLISEMDVAEAKSFIEKGVVGGGMLPKLTNCIDAIENGVSLMADTA